MPAVVEKRRLGEEKEEAEGGKETKGILLIVGVGGIESP